MNHPTQPPPETQAEPASAIDPEAPYSEQDRDQLIVLLGEARALLEPLRSTPAEDWSNDDCFSVAHGLADLLGTPGPEGRPTAATSPLGQPVADFVAAWSSPHTAGGVAEHLTCSELNALCGLLRHLGQDTTADAWHYAHALSDEPEDAHYGDQHLFNL